MRTVTNTTVAVHSGPDTLAGMINIPENAVGLVLFAHGSGSSRLSPRNQQVARYLNTQGIGTLLFDLLTLEEERTDRFTYEFRFNIPLLANRLTGATDWAVEHFNTNGLPIGYFGASTGAAAALIAAARKPGDVRAVVSRGGRTDLADDFMDHVTAATLFIVGELDDVVLDLNRKSHNLLTSAAARELAVVEGATHLFEEPGKLEEVSDLAVRWFRKHLPRS